MLSYLHAFHAGHWADVHKHVALVALLDRLRAKPKPFSVTDVHAGDGVYDLGSTIAQKTAQYRDGIGRLFKEARPEGAVGRYLDIAAAANLDGELRCYPGSPAIIQALLRPDDRLIANELHPAAYQRLAIWRRDDPRVQVHRRDAAALMAALLPPQPRRGLALIDPAYEVKDEYRQLPIWLGDTLARWPIGMFLIWYPLLAAGRHATLLEGLAGLDAAVLLSELGPKTAGPGMLASGLAIVNPPWRFEEELAAAGDWLVPRLWPEGGEHRWRWLKPPN